MSDFICPEGARLIPLGSRKWPGRFAIVDAEDYEYLSQIKWTCTERGRHQKLYYAYHSSTSEERSNGWPRTLTMHRAILGDIGSLHVDHINHNGLDNRRCNLRAVSHTENMQNRRASIKNNKTESDDYDRRRPFKVGLCHSRKGDKRHPMFVATTYMFDKRAFRAIRKVRTEALRLKYEAEIMRRAVLLVYGL